MLHSEGIINPVERANARLKKQVHHSMRGRDGYEVFDDPAYKILVDNAKLRREIGHEVEEAMQLAEEPHEALTQVQTQPTRIIHNPYKTQPLGEEE